MFFLYFCTYGWSCLNMQDLRWFLCSIICKKKWNRCKFTEISVQEIWSYFQSQTSWKPDYTLGILVDSIFTKIPPVLSDFLILEHTRSLTEWIWILPTRDFFVWKVIAFQVSHLFARIHIGIEWIISDCLLLGFSLYYPRIHMPIIVHELYYLVGLKLRLFISWVVRTEWLYMLPR